MQADVLPGTKRRHVVVFTDGQQSDWNMSDSPGWQRLTGGVPRGQVPTEIKIKNVGSPQSGHRTIWLSTGSI